MKMRLTNERTRNGQIFPYPEEGRTVYETPNVFRWLKAPGARGYRLTVKTADGTVAASLATDINYAVPKEPLAPGRYFWSVASDNGYVSDEVKFTVAEDAIVFIRPDPDEVFASVPDVRPRELFFDREREAVIKAKPAAVATLRRNVALALTRPLPEPPMFHRDPEALPYREYFGRHRDTCDRDMMCCAIAYALLDDEAAGQKAKDIFLTLCDWNPSGPCSLESIWGDEIGLSHARCFPLAFDMLWKLLDEKQRVFCARVVAEYAFQCERNLDRLDFGENPGYSHQGRLPAYMGEAAMALKGTNAVPEETLRRWLGKALEIYGGLFPYYGTDDGGWAEGMFYASSYTKWYLPFFGAVRRFSGCDLTVRPFYRNYPKFLAAFCPPGWEIHPFGDGYWCRPTDAEWPGFFAQDPYNVYAELSGSRVMRAWAAKAQDSDIFRLHAADEFIPPRDEADIPEKELQRAYMFPDAGFISLHTDPEHPESELALLARSSPFGSVSHEHADQGSFALMAGGTALISPSGYFGRAYGTKHHLEWTNSTRAHNTLLIGGKGQETFSFRAAGRVISAKDEGDRLTAEIDPSEAYGGLIEYWRRSFELTKDRLIVRDEVRLREKASITYLLHTLSRPQEEPFGALVERNGKRMEIRPLKGISGAPVISDEFAVPLNEGEPEKYAVEMPPQYHMSWETEEAAGHEIEVAFIITDTKRG